MTRTLLINGERPVRGVALSVAETARRMALLKGYFSEQPSLPIRIQIANSVVVPALVLFTCMKKL